MHGRRISPIQKTINIMVQRKKTADNPPLSLRNALIKNSVADTWEEALIEWEMRAYYYLPPGKYKSCPCNPRGINNITILVNKHNSKQMEICNRCAELYFKISESRSLEGTARRVRNNQEFVMNLDALDYLLLNQVISFREHQCYNALKNKRSDPKIIRFKEETNGKLINFTDYNNKTAFDDIDNILVWAQDHPEFDIKPIVAIWKSLLNNHVSDTKCLDLIINDNNINRKFYPDKTIIDARKLLQEYMDAENVDSHVNNAFLTTIPETLVTDRWGYYTKRDIPTREEYMERKNHEKLHNMSNQNEPALETEDVEKKHSNNDEWEEDSINWIICYKGKLVDCRDEAAMKAIDLKIESLENKVDEDQNDGLCDNSNRNINDFKEKQKSFREELSWNSKIENAFEELGKLIYKYIQRGSIKINYSHDDEVAIAGDFVACLNIPHINKLYNESLNYMLFFEDLFTYCDDMEIGYLLSGAILNCAEELRDFFITNANNILIEINKKLVHNDKAVGYFQYSIVNCE